MMPIDTLPLFVIYVAWHPNNKQGESLARAIYEHYHRSIYDNVAGGAGINVFYRSVPERQSGLPISINFSAAKSSAVVLLVDQNWAADVAWINWGNELTTTADQAGLNNCVIPVAIEGSALGIGMINQFTRWDQWNSMSEKARLTRLISKLTYQFARMLRLYLEGLKHSMSDEEALTSYLRKVEIFISHSKHDKHGEAIALATRKFLQEDGDLESFFDADNIPTGRPFNKVIISKIGTSAVVSIHTDSYSSREWCRREIIEAKRKSVPLIIANCLDDYDERGFPYMGNVPIVRMDPANVTDRIDQVVGALLDEVMKDFLWRCRVELSKGRDVLFLPRPPELISLVVAAEQGAVNLVYPDPPIGAEEAELFQKVAPSVQLKCVTKWLAEEGL